MFGLRLKRQHFVFLLLSRPDSETVESREHRVLLNYHGRYGQVLQGKEAGALEKYTQSPLDHHEEQTDQLELKIGKYGSWG